MNRTCRLLSLIIREALSFQRLKRRPEPMASMNDLQSVEGFHAEGAATGSLLPIYHFNALATSRLMPEGGTLVDLGSGSGQYLAYLAHRRPDIRIIGFDLSEAMVRVGNHTLEQVGLQSRVELKIGDMTRFSQLAPKQVDMVSSVFALHHLPTTADVVLCLEEAVKVRAQYGCGIWIFDHSRPRCQHTAEEFPEIFTPEASVTFRQDSRNSLMAAFSFTELSELLDHMPMETLHHMCSRFMRLYQVHWLERKGEKLSDGRKFWVDEILPPQAAKEFKQLRRILRGAPLP